MTTAAQDEFNDLVAKNAGRETLHPEDRNDPDRDGAPDLSEEDTFRNAQIDAAMRSTSGSAELNLPPVHFDGNHSTGVKGVIADARSYETARKSTWRSRVRTAARRSIFGLDGAAASARKSESETDEDAHSGSDGPDEEAFLQQWRESRRRELESEASRSVRNRRTSPSVRVYGRMDEVDAMGYLDAVEKVARETTVVVFVYDHEVCAVSSLHDRSLC
jgi:hypothetical protein